MPITFNPNPIVNYDLTRKNAGGPNIPFTSPTLFPAAPAAPAAPSVPGWAQPWEAMGLSPDYYLQWGGAAGQQQAQEQPNYGAPAPQQPQYLAPPPGLGATPGIAPPIPNPLAPNPNVINPLPPGYTSLDIPEELYSFVPEPLRQGFGSAITGFLQRLGYRGTGNVGRYGERSYAFPAGTTQPYFSPEMFGYITDPYIRQLIQYLFGERGQSARIPLPTAPPMA